MSNVAIDEVAHLWERAMALPVNLRVGLAIRILETSKSPVPSQQPTAAPELTRRGLSAQELSQLLKSDNPPPDDETVKRWIHEHRMEKYG